MIDRKGPVCYTHYRLTIPNENFHITMSGNYKLTIYDDTAETNNQEDETFDKEGMKDLLYNPKEICFEDASQKFRLIEDGGVSVIVNTGENMALVEQLKTEWMSYALMKQLSQYSVTIHKGDFEKLKRFGAVEEIIESIFVVNDRAQYDECIGLRLDNHWLSETLII